MKLVCADSRRKRGRRWPPVGRFRYLTREDRWEWSEEVARMHGYTPGSITPTTQLLLKHKHPDDKPNIAELIEQIRRHGTAFSSRHRIVDTRGETHVVVVVGDRFPGPDGRLLGIGGFYIDVTEQYDADLQKHLSEALLAVDSRRAVINQAMGILMLRYGVGSDAAFELLVKLSQESNVKLRNIAERVVAEISARDDEDDDAAYRVDRLLRAPREVL
ncbi:ANTAR domain-containing protein [Mycobacterium vicinigordonae]|uniref:histidine kinase n=2 Tax=Mycobacterium vicinigordonae TaxID=1719132 RepID=A0A7D6I554_9MYCO|nr:PAS and ANTAR domain-containing protein [Mycobacterium vicinigordonae]QLL07178.1 ANTAR domain-containing protein [Mycobacterium vicinigordonae]